VSLTCRPPTSRRDRGDRGRTACRADDAGCWLRDDRHDGGGFADHPIPALATVSLGKAALRSAATMLGPDLKADGVRVTTLTIDGQIVAGTPFDPERIAERYWQVVSHRGRLSAV
jgi:hypothetical protein